MSLLNEALFFIDHRGKCVIAQRRRDAGNRPPAEESEVLAATPEDRRQEPFSALFGKWRDTGGR